jgi:subtilisin family serine protease
MLQSIRLNACAVGLASLFVLTACSDHSPVAPVADGSQAQGDNTAGPSASLTGLNFSQTSFARRGGVLGDRHLIVLKEGTDVAAIVARIRAMGGRVQRQAKDISVVSVEGLTDPAAVSLKADGAVEGVTRDVKVNWLPPARGLRHGPRLPAKPLSRRTDQSGAEFFAEQWYLRTIRANNAWLVTSGGAHTLVCVLDSGVDPDHIELKGKIDFTKSTSFVTTEPEILDFDTHGTAVASLITSNGLGMASVAPNTRICAVKVLDQTGQGSFDDVINGVIFAALAHADIINMSLGAALSKNDPGVTDLMKVFQRAVNFARRRGSLVVASSGNDGIDFNSAASDLIVVPAQLKQVLSVEATAPINQQNFDRIASYSNFGSKGADVAAPGGDFIDGQSVPEDLMLAACSSKSKTLPFDCSDGRSYLLGAGTSFSAPLTSGEAAVIRGQIRWDGDGERTAKCIERGADHVTGARVDPVYGFGRINVLGGAIYCGSTKSTAES